MAEKQDSRSLRQAALLRLVRKERIASQDEFVRRMNEAGFAVNQASVSRDLRELGVVKLRGRYVLPAALSAAPPGGSGSPANALITEAVPVGANLVVVRTVIGAASAVAARLDRRNLGDVAGSLAGDDTIFVAVRSRAAQGRVLALFRSGELNTDGGAVVDEGAGA